MVEADFKDRGITICQFLLHVVRQTVRIRVECRVLCEVRRDVGRDRQVFARQDINIEFADGDFDPQLAVRVDGRVQKLEIGRVERVMPTVVIGTPSVFSFWMSATAPARLASFSML